MSPDEPSLEPRRGRPRDPAADRALLETALRHLARHGFAGMSLAAVAEDAGYNKPTLYRRWPNKTKLAEAALAILEPPSLEPPTGETRQDLGRALEQMIDPTGSGPQLALLGSVLTEAERHPELLREYRLRVGRRQRNALRSILEAAAARGEFRDEADLEVAVEALLGAVQARAIGLGESPPGFHWQAVDLVLRALSP